MDRASDLRLYYSSSVGFRILPPKNNFYEKYIFNIFFFLPTFSMYWQVRHLHFCNRFEIGTLIVDKTCDSQKEPALFDGLLGHPYRHSQTLCTSHL